MLATADLLTYEATHPRTQAQVLGFDAAEVINRLLEGSLPPSVAALDPHMPMAAVEAATASLPSSSAAAARPSANGEDNTKV